MGLKQFFTSKIFLKHIGLALAITLVLAWLAMLVMSVYTNRGESFPTPDFSGKTIEEAEDLADDQGVRFLIEDSVYRKDVSPGIVLRQTPLAGHKVKPGRKVYLTVSAAYPEQVEIPKLTDVSLRQARVLLESKGFAMGSVEYRPSEFNDLVLDAKYSGQSIFPGSRIDNGATIDLVVGRNLSNSETLIPDLTGLSLESATSALSAKSLNVGVVLYDPSVLTSDDSLKSRVIKQSPVADSTSVVSQGSLVDLWLGFEVINSEL